MASKAKKKREISSDRLLKVSARLFREQGYAATSVREIAKAAGMKSGSIYYHYPSKEAILEAVIDRAQATLMTAVEQALADLGDEAPFDAKLAAAMKAHLNIHHKQGDFALTSRGGLNLLPADRKKIQYAKRKEYGELWKQLFQEGVASGEVTSKADIVPTEMFVLGALNWTSEWLDTRRLSLERAGDVFANLILEGLHAR